MSEEINLRFGKLAAKHDYRTLLYKDFVGTLPAPSVSLSNTQRAYKALGNSNPAEVFPMDGNDTEGDCTMAEAAHLTTAANAYIGKKKIPAAHAVVSAYLKMSGGQDTGLNVLDVLNHWRKNGLFGEKILGFVKLDPKNHIHVQQAMQYFLCYSGFQVQANCMADFNAGKVWTPGKLLNEGHAVPGMDYDADTVSVLTWGAVQKGTWGWWDACIDEAYAVIPKEAKTPGYAPGFNLAQLEAAIQGLAG